MSRKPRFDGIRGEVTRLRTIVANAIRSIQWNGSAAADLDARAQAVRRPTRELARAADPAEVAQIVSELAGGNGFNVQVNWSPPPDDYNVGIRRGAHECCGIGARAHSSARSQAHDTA